MQLLHIDSSVLGAYSASRTLSAEIVARQVALHPGIQVVRRDLAADAALHLSPAHLAAWQGGAVEDALLGADIKKGGGYLQELTAADIVVIGAPMYNFSIPSQLKAWIDRVVIAGKTFRYGPNGAEGLLLIKRVFSASLGLPTSLLFARKDSRWDRRRATLRCQKPAETLRPSRPDWGDSHPPPKARNAATAARALSACACANESRALSSSRSASSTSRKLTVPAMYCRCAASRARALAATSFCRSTNWDSI